MVTKNSSPSYLIFFIWIGPILLKYTICFPIIIQGRCIVQCCPAYVVLNGESQGALLRYKPLYSISYSYTLVQIFLVYILFSMTYANIPQNVNMSINDRLMKNTSSGRTIFRECVLFSTQICFQLFQRSVFYSFVDNCNSFLIIE